MKRILILCLSLILPLCGCGNNSTQSDVNYESVSMSEGIERMANDEGHIMLDVRRVDEFEAGHIPGAGTENRNGICKRSVGQKISGGGYYSSEHKAPALPLCNQFRFLCGR